MKALITYLPAFACLAMLLIVCVPMLFNRHWAHQDNEAAELREEVARLRAELAQQDEPARVDG